MTGNETPDTQPAQPKPDRAAKARATLMHRTNLKLAARLREHGWIPVPPEVAATLPPEVVEMLSGRSDHR